MLSATLVITFIQRAIVQSIPLLFGSTGEILTEKSGNLNLGIPGIMYVGGISGVIGSFIYENSLAERTDIRALPAVLIPLVCTIVGSLLMGLLYTARKSECYRSCHHHLRCRIRQLFRRIHCQADKERDTLGGAYQHQSVLHKVAALCR